MTFKVKLPALNYHNRKFIKEDCLASRPHDHVFHIALTFYPSNIFVILLSKQNSKPVPSCESQSV